MMKWFGIAVLILAVAIRAWRILPVDLAIRVSPGLHKGYPVGPTVFWMLLIGGLALVYFGFRSHAH